MVIYLKLRLSLSIKLQGKDSSGVTLPYRWESENQVDRELDEVTVKGKEKEEQGRKKDNLYQNSPLKWCSVLVFPLSYLLKVKHCLICCKYKTHTGFKFPSLDPAQNSLQNGCDEDCYKTSLRKMFHLERKIFITTSDA